MAKIPQRAPFGVLKELCEEIVKTQGRVSFSLAGFVVMAGYIFVKTNNVLGLQKLTAFALL
ncbi:hypothetical protein [Helicobacter felis]|uniref:hypothetical protein n=1 Tax=Helicobacter felis TaxID=214 RepID=UPI000CF04641|nr:hypothetical protein [Helicobacter felis]